MRIGVLLIIFLIMCTGLLDTLSQTMLKITINAIRPQVRSMKNAIFFVFSLMRYLKLWLSFILSTVSLGLWLFVLTKAELNFAYSIDSVRYIFIALASVFLLKERIGLLRGLGIAVVILGIFLVSFS